MTKNIKKITYVVTIIVTICFIIAICPRTMQNDTFWSIKVGEKILNEGFEVIDEFSIHEGLEYVAHHYMTDILIYVVYTMGDFFALYLLEIVLAIIIGGLLFILNKQVCKSSIIAILLMIIQMVALQGYITVRAQMISFILFILELICLEKFKQKEDVKYLVSLGIIPILLANFHMGVVPFYFIILAVNIIGYMRIKILCFETVEKTDITRIKKLIFVAIIGVVTIFINPYFIDGVIYPYKTFENEFINSHINEFQAFRINWDGGLTFAYISLIMICIFISKSKIKLEDMLLILGTLFMAFMAIRYISLFVICSYVILRYVKVFKSYIEDESVLKPLKVTMVIVALFVCTLISIDRLVINQKDFVDKTLYPVDATKVLKKVVNEDTRIFNLYHWGSYLMLNDIPVYIDSRCDLYTEEYNNVTIATDYINLLDCSKDFKQIIAKYNLNTFVLSPEHKLVTLLKETGEYNFIYEDDTAIILVNK